MNALLVIPMALASAISWILICSVALGYKRTLRWHIAIDILFFVGLKVLYFGTYEGMTTALVAGFCCTVILLILRACTPNLKTNGNRHR